MQYHSKVWGWYVFIFCYVFEICPFFSLKVHFFYQKYRKYLLQFKRTVLYFVLKCNVFLWWQSWTSSIITITVFNVIWFFRNHSNMLILALKKHFQTFLKQVKIKKMNAMFFLIFELILSSYIYIVQNIHFKVFKKQCVLMCFIFLHYIFSFCSLFVLYKQSLFLTSYTASEIASLHFFVYLICS